MNFRSLKALLWKRGGRGLLLAAAGWTLLLALGAGGWIFATPGSGDAAPAWGEEVLAETHASFAALSPIALANACGLGASSCFKCHNGKRAPQPAQSVETSPWHAQHLTVNYSCAGCHGGNPRILKQEIAHQKLIANPLTQPDKSCASCHTAQQTDTRLSAYQQILDGARKP